MIKISLKNHIQKVKENKKIIYKLITIIIQIYHYLYIHLDNLIPNIESQISFKP
jgi:hypothetical protein